MHQIPRRLHSMIPAREILQVKNWWQKLSHENRIVLQDLYDENAPDDDQLVPLHLCGRFVEQEKVNSNDVFWVNHFYDYLVNHQVVIEQKYFVGGICSAQKAAVRVIRRGIIPANFRCPLGGKNCLMVQLLDERPGLSLQFYVSFGHPGLRPML